MIANDEGKQFEILKVNRYEVQQNAIFLDYNIETLTSQIEKFSQIKYHLRLSIAKNLGTIQEVLINNKTQFSKLLQKLSKDHEDMQVQLLQYLKSKQPLDAKKQNFKQLILTPLINLANGPFLEVELIILQIKQSSCHLISQLAPNLPEKQLEEIVQFANQLAKSDNQENKIVVIQLLAGLAKILPTAKRQSTFENQFLNIYSGSSVRVKKEIILELGNLAENLSSQFVDSKIIRGFYLKQTKDNAWGIRKACVQIITGLLIKSKTAKQELCNVLMNLLKDGNKFVRIASHKIIPQFIAKYGQKNVPKAVFDTYLSLIDLDINNQVSKPNEIIQKISFYFPGVLQTVGVSKWPQLNPLFNKLLHNRNQVIIHIKQDVKKPLADGLHQISQIIGPNNSKQYLFSSLDYILRQQIDSIKLCAIRNLSKFVAQFESQTKQNLIDVFLVLQKDPKKWRVRFQISNQLKYLSQNYDAQTIFKYIFPISLKLCNDQVSEVRKAASAQIIYVINQLKTQEGLYHMAVQSLIGYAVSQKYLQRQTFCLMIQSLYEKSEQFYKTYGQSIKQLCKDSVPLVRIALSISIVNILYKHPSQYQRLKEYIDILSEDEQVKQNFEEYQSQQKSNVEQKS